MEIEKCREICKSIEKTLINAELPFFKEVKLLDFLNNSEKEKRSEDFKDVDDIGERTISILVDDIFHDLMGR